MKNKIEKTEDNIVSLSGDDNQIKSFKEKAQDDLDYLINFMNEHEKDDELFRYAVKSNFIEDDESEHMWVQVNEFATGYFKGQLVNDPETMKLVKYGDYVKVLRDDVEDWILEDFLTNTKVGGFSSGYLKSKSNQS